MKRIATITLVFAILAVAMPWSASAQSVLHYWNFNDPVENGNPWSEPVEATIGEGVITFSFNEGSLEDFGGTTTNAQEGDEAGASFAVVGEEQNGEHFDIEVSTTGDTGAQLAYATQGTSTGFNEQTISYSADGGSTFETHDTVTVPGSFELRSFDFSDVSELNDNPDVVFRVTVDGATSGSGNNRFDNITVTGDGTDDGVIPIAEARQQPDGTEVTVEGVVTRSQGRFTRFQDDTAGLTVFDFDADFSEDVQEGDELRITSELTTFNELRQLEAPAADDFEVLSSGNDLPAPAELTLEAINENGEDFESQLVEVEDITDESGEAIFRPETTYAISDPTNGGQLRVQRSGDTGIDGQPIPDEPYTFRGVLSRFQDDFQLEPVNTTDVFVGEEPPDTDDLLACEVQGTGFSTPFEGETVTTTGNVVTAEANNGFFMQMPDGTDEACPEGASRGLFVFTDSPPDVSSGDLVDVTGEAQEFFGWTQIGENPEVTTTGTETVPAPVTFDASTPSPEPSAVPDLYRYQSMVVEVEGGIATSPTDQFGNFFVDAGGELDVDRNFRQPGIGFPGVEGVPEWDGNQQLFEIETDPGNFPSGFNVDVSRGDVVETARGPLPFRFGEHRIWPSELELDQQDPDEEIARGVRETEGAEFTVGTFNLFDLISGDTPGGFDNRLSKQASHVCDLMRTPTVLGIQEAGSASDLEALAGAIEDECGANYETHTTSPDPRGIELGALVKSSVEDLTFTEKAADETLDFSPNNVVHDRPPLLIEGTVQTDVGPFPMKTLVVHNRSRVGIEDTDLENVEDEFIVNKRLEQAESIARIVQDIQDEDPSARLAVLGDFNAFEFTDGLAHVVGEIQGEVAPGEQLLEGDVEVDPALTNQVSELDPLERYSFIFEGTAQVLDHILTSEALTDFVSDRAYVRANIDAPNADLSDPETPLASSDHDAMVAFVDPADAVSDEQEVAITREFGDPTEQNNYQLVGVPGAAGVPLEETLSGESGADWRAFVDTGAEGENPDEFLRELEGDDTFASGRGAWLLSREPWNVDTTVSGVPLDSEGNHVVALQDGWNIIVNPFDRDIPWSVVRDENDLDDEQPLWRWENGEFAPVQTLADGQEGEAFYVFNDPADERSGLVLPGGEALTAEETATPSLADEESVIQLRASTSEGSAVVPVRLGWADESIQHVAPRAPFETTSLYATDEASDRRLATNLTEEQPENNYTFDLILEADPDRPVTLQALGLENVDGQRVVLVEEEGPSHDLTEDPEVQVQPRGEQTTLQVLVGDAEFVGDEVGPEEVEVYGNYPNPFADQTTIEYELPETMDVHIAVFDALGRSVTTLIDEQQTAGRHELVWDASQSLSSGVYFIRFEIDGRRETQRATLIR